MQLGSTNSTDITTLLGLTRFYANTLNNTSDFSDAMITALLNQKYKVWQALVFSNSFNNWEDNTVDGSGSGEINLVSGTNSYSIPVDMIAIDRLEVNYTGDANGWKVARAINLYENDSAVSNASTTQNVSGTKENPIYWVRSGKIYLDPMPDQSVSGGLKVWCKIEVSDLSGSTDEPSLFEAYQPGICMDAAVEHLTRVGSDKLAQQVSAKSSELKGQMIKALNSRNIDRLQKARMSGSKRKYR